MAKILRINEIYLCFFILSFFLLYKDLYCDKLVFMYFDVWWQLNMKRSNSLSSLFVDDAIFFLVTIVPLIYFFGANFLLLGCGSHLVSIFCAGIAYDSTLNVSRAFLLTLGVTASTFVDLILLLFSACQYLSTDLCCNALSLIGITCFARYYDAMLAIFLFPVSVYNFVKGIARLLKIWSSISGKGMIGFGLAFVVCIKLVYFALVFNEGDDALLLSLMYSAFAASAATLDWKNARTLLLCFLVDHIMLILQARSYFDNSSIPLVIVSLVNLSSSTTLVLCLPTVVSRWVMVYVLATAFSAIYICSWLWASWSIVHVTLLVPYFIFTVTRAVAYRANYYFAIIIFSSIFIVSDFAAMIYMLTNGWLSIGFTLVMAFPLLVSVYTLCEVWDRINILEKTFKNAVANYHGNTTELRKTPSEVQRMELKASLFFDTHKNEEVSEIVEKIAELFDEERPVVCEMILFLRVGSTVLDATVSSELTSDVNLRIMNLTQDLYNANAYSECTMAYSMHETQESILSSVIASFEHLYSAHTVGNKRKEMAKKEVKRRFIFLASTRSFEFASDLERKATIWKIARDI